LEIVKERVSEITWLPAEKIRESAGMYATNKPACIGWCLTFGDLNDPNSKVSQKVREAGDNVFVLKPEKGSNPSIRYIKPPGVSLDKITRLDKAVVMYGFKKQPHV